MEGKRSADNSSRLSYIDGVKYIAIFVVFVTHYIDDFHPEYFKLWEDMPTYLILGGVTGKFGVAIFGVILGYFAYLTNETSIEKYAISRYTYFLICGLLINMVYAALGYFNIFTKSYSIKKVIKVSLLLSSEIYKTYWCARPFFIASVLSCINGKAGLKSGGLLIEIAILLYWGHTWTAICLMGNVAAYIMKMNLADRLLKNGVVRISVYLLVLMVIKIPIKNWRYIIYGVCAVLLIVTISSGNRIKKILASRPISNPGKNTMAIYITHVLIYKMIGAWTIDFGIVHNIPYIGSFSFGLIMSWTVIVAFSYPLTYVIRTVMRKINPIEDKMIDNFERFLYQGIKRSSI